MNQTNNSIEFTKLQAKRYILSHQYLLPPKNLAGKEGILTLIDRLGCIQFDTINVVGRNADLVLQSRISNYSSTLLEELLYKDRTLLDGWDKVASIYKSEDWPNFARQRHNLGSYYENRAEEPRKIIPEVLEFLKTKGPLSSLELKGSKKTDWAWGPTTVTRAALELLNAKGTIGIHHRVNTRRYFDLIENLIPEQILSTKDPNTTDEEYLEWHVLRRIGSLGIASIQSGEHWLGILGGRKVTDRRKFFPRLIDKGLLLPVKIEDLNSEYYIRPNDLQRFEKTKDQNPSKKISFIAPLDNLIWDRKSTKSIFDFEYVWEVYKPKKIRKYGYYVLPVLFGDEFIARIDFQYDKKSGDLTVANWWWEDGYSPEKKLLKAITDALVEFSHYLGAKTCKLSKSTMSKLPIKDVPVL